MLSASALRRAPSSVTKMALVLRVVMMAMVSVFAEVFGGAVAGTDPSGRADRMGGTNRPRDLRRMVSASVDTP